MRKTVILINGKAQSGKSTLAELLASKIQNSKVIHNADSVKELATNFFGWNGVKDDDGRELLIGISEVGYDYKDNFWEYKTLSKVEDKDEVIIIPDFRYEQTYHFFKEQGFRVITLYVSMTKDINTMNVSMKEHSTEQRLNIKFDTEFINKFGKEEQLEEFADEFIKYYKLKKIQTFEEELECARKELQKIYDFCKKSSIYKDILFAMDLLEGKLSNGEVIANYLFFDDKEEKFLYIKDFINKETMKKMLELFK